MHPCVIHVYLGPTCEDCRTPSSLGRHCRGSVQEGLTNCTTVLMPAAASLQARVLEESGQRAAAPRFCQAVHAGYPKTALAGNEAASCE